MEISWWQLLTILLGWTPWQLSEAPSQKLPDHQLEEVALWSFESQDLRWEMHAAEGTYHRETGVFEGTKVHAFFYEPGGEQIEVRCQRASSQKRQKGSILMEGQVEMRLPDGFLLKSQVLIFDPDTHQFEIPSHVVVHGRGPFGDGARLRFISLGLLKTKDTSMLFLQRDVQFYISGSKQETQIFSDQARLDFNQNRADFMMRRPKGHVDILQTDLFARGKRASLYFYPDTQELESWELEQNVLIINTENPQLFRMKPTPQPQRYATSGKAYYHAATSILELTEYPQMTEDEDTFTGDKMLMDTRLKTVETRMTRGKSKVK